MQRLCGAALRLRETRFFVAPSEGGADRRSLGLQALYTPVGGAEQQVAGAWVEGGGSAKLSSTRAFQFNPTVHIHLVKLLTEA